MNPLILAALAAVVTGFASAQDAPHLRGGDGNGVAGNVLFPSAGVGLESEELGEVEINNDYPSEWLWGKAYITHKGLPATKGQYRVELINALDFETLAGPVGLTADGLFSLGVIRVPGTSPGRVGSLVLRAWEVLAPGRETYSDALSRNSAMIWVPLGGGPLPPTSLANGNFAGMDLYMWWGIGGGNPWLPSPSQDIKLEQLAGGMLRITAFCRDKFFEYFLVGSSDLRNWVHVDLEGGDPDVITGMVEWVIQEPEFGTMFYKILP